MTDSPAAACWPRPFQGSDRGSPGRRWLNAVEGFFAKLMRRRLKHGVFHSLVDLQQAINTFIQTHNAKPKPFVWKANPKAIIAAAKRGHQVLENIQ